jgi:hypothetical protein
MASVVKFVPPQKFASYRSKYQPQVGNREENGCMKALCPQISKATLRTTFGGVLSMVSMLGIPVGTGNGPAGSGIFTGRRPQTTMVARVTGKVGLGRSEPKRTFLGAGSMPEAEITGHPGEDAGSRA